MGSHRHVLEASAAAHQLRDPAALAIVVDTQGSTYVRPGAMALFGACIVGAMSLAGRARGRPVRALNPETPE